MSVTIDLPVKPHVGLRFRPDTTDSIGTITHVSQDSRRGPVVAYVFDHEPAQTHSRPWSEVRNLGWAIR